MTSSRGVEWTIWTDGACLGNPGPGGWAALVRGEREVLLKGGEAWTTNNRMELKAALMGLLATPEGARVEVRTDSRYLKNAFTEGWLARWQEHGWRTKTGPVKNQDLWEELLKAVQARQVRWAFVKGHAGIRENELVDRLAVQEAKSQRDPPGSEGRSGFRARRG